MDMKPASRVTDKATGYCTSHRRTVEGTITTGQDNVITEGQKQAIVGDTVTFECDHTGLIVTGTTIVKVNNKPAAIIGSLVEGDVNGSIITGATKVNMA